MAAPYDDIYTYVRDEERYLLLMLRRYAVARRARGLDRPWADATGRMDDVELAAWFEGASGDVLEASSMDGALVALRRRIDERLEATRSTGLVLAADSLNTRLGLDAAASVVLLALAVCQQSPALGERLVTLAGTRFRPWPRAGALAEILGPDPDQRGAILDALGPAGLLARVCILAVGPAPEGWPPEVPLPVEHRTVVLAQRTVDFLAGRSEAIDERLTGCCVVESSDPGHGDTLPAELRETLAALLPEPGTGARVLPAQPLWLIGPRGSGVLALAVKVAALFDCRLLRVRVARWLHLARRPSAGELLREAVLGARAVMLDFCDVDDALLQTREPQTLVLDLLHEVEALARELRIPFLLASHHPLQLLRLHASHAEPVTTGYPPPPRRSALWTHHLEAANLASPPGPELRRLAQTFVFSEEDIVRVVRHASRLTRTRAAPPSIADLEEICRDDLDVRLQGLTRRVRQTARLEDLVLSDEQREGLEEIVSFARFRDQLFEEWGFGAHYASGKGVHCLFTGPPGTGKTLAASIVANALELPLYRIELSQVVDRYVGETEKRLEQIFDESARFPCALLFDEADSLFGKRTEVRSSNDRYANTEVNYLLQRMEDFEGITILTTNLETSLDQAFLRRIRFSVRFPEPDRALAQRLWRKLLPSETEPAGPIDFERLATRFEMTGGHIKNAILRAALNAMREKRGVTQADLETAAVVEYAKLGKLAPSRG